ncbi:MAG: hypothetical protein ABJA82_00345 [Myxococcales bacterium]
MSPPSARHRAYVRSRFASVLAALALVPVAACSSDIFDVSVELMAESFQVDFGTTMGNISTVACNSQNVANCGAGQVINLADDAGDVNIMPGCDASTAQCFVQASAVVRYTVDVLKDEAFTSKVARKSVSAVRMLDIRYTVPANTTTFDLPRVDVLVGPSGSRTPNDAGVYKMDSVDPLPAGTVITDHPRHLTVQDGSPAREVIENNIKAKKAFVFMLSVTPRLSPGTPVPAGMLQVQMVPLLGLGLR